MYICVFPPHFFSFLFAGIGGGEDRGIWRMCLKIEKKRIARLVVFTHLDVYLLWSYGSKE